MWIAFAIFLVLVPLAVIIVRRSRSFAEQADATWEGVWAQADIQPRQYLTEEALQAFPEPLQRFARYTALIDKPFIQAAEFRQSGYFRNKSDSAWMPLRARQLVTVDPPAMVWRARIDFLGFLPVLGLDSFQGGQGRMIIRPMGLFPVADASGYAIDQGALVRLLGEMAFLPTALFGPLFHWKRLNKDQAVARVEFNDLHVELSATFEDSGALKTIDAYRYMDGASDPQPFRMSYWDYQQLGGYRLPRRGSATWRLPAGDFEYVRLHIEEAQFFSGAKREAATSYALV